VTTRTDAKDRMGHLSIYGLPKNVYACFNGADGDVIKSLLHKLLISYVDPVEKENGILWGGHKASNEWVQQCKEIVKNMEPLRYNHGMSVHRYLFLSHLLIPCYAKKAKKKNAKGHRQCNKNGAIVVIGLI
jgi:hypothetical protein